MGNVLEIQGLVKSFRHSLTYKRIPVLHGIDFDVPQGQVTGFLGANGSGKTTTIKCMLHLNFPDSGKIRFFGSDNLSKAVLSRIGFLPERPYFYDYLTGYEFLKFYASLSKRVERDQMDRRIKEMLERVRLADAGHKQLREYSKGMLQRIGIAQAIIHRPDFVILDEPMTGLDPDGRKEVNDIIRETASEGTTVFFSSHLLHDVEQISDRLVILKKGRVLFQGLCEDFVGKIQQPFRLTYVRNSRKELVTTDSETELQKKIDQIRGEKLDILEIKKDKVSLEEAFIELAVKD